MRDEIDLKNGLLSWF